MSVYTVRCHPLKMMYLELTEKNKRFQTERGGEWEGKNSWDRTKALKE